MSDLLLRIRRVTEDLQTIQETLDDAARPGAPLEERERILEELLEAKVLTDFKTAVDHMRHLLWSYVEASATRDPEAIRRNLQAVRMQRVTEMLRVLEPSVAEEAASAAPEARGFFEEIHKIAHATIERHRERPH